MNAGKFYFPVKRSRQRGQGMAEFGVVATLFIVPLLIGMTWLARVESSKQHLHQAARYAAWERTVWYRSGSTYVTKNDTDVAREVTRRVYSPVRHLVDTNRDRLAVDMSRDRLDPFLYTQDYRTGNSLPMFRPIGSQQSRASVAYARSSESGAIASLLDGAGRFLQLQSDGIATSTVSAEIEVIPSIRSLGSLPATFTSQSQNALLGGAWNANGPEGEARSVRRTVATTAFDSIPGFDLLKSMVGVLFPEIDTLDPGHVDVEKMACQRVSSLATNC